jgi:hypothetical protein
MSSLSDCVYGISFKKKNETITKIRQEQQGCMGAWATCFVLHTQIAEAMSRIVMDRVRDDGRQRCCVFVATPPFAFANKLFKALVLVS